jgi:hypothetical protein
LLASHTSARRRREASDRPRDEARSIPGRPGGDHPVGWHAAQRPPRGSQRPAGPIHRWVPAPPPPPTATRAAARPFNDLASALGRPLAPAATRLEWQLDCGRLAQARHSYPPCSVCPRPTCAVLGSNLLGGTSLLLGLDGGRFAAQQRLDVLVPVRGFKRCVDYQNGFGAPSQRSAGVQGSPAQGVRRAFPVEVAPASLRR